MSKKAGDVEQVNWGGFSELHENQRELLRKLKFITRAASPGGSEAIALELLDDYLARKELELKELRRPDPGGESPGKLNGKSKDLDPNSLCDRYADFCRKIRFLISGALKTQDESLGLQIISDVLEQKEKDLHELKVAAKDRIEEGAESVELLLGRLLMEREDYKLLQRIGEIRKDGGPRWDMMQSLLLDQPPQTAAPRRPLGFKDDHS